MVLAQLIIQEYGVKVQFWELLNILEVLDTLTGHEVGQNVHVSNLREISQHLQNALHIGIDLGAAEVYDFGEEEAEMKFRISICIVHPPTDLITLEVNRCIPTKLVLVQEKVYFVLFAHNFLGN